MPASAAYRSFFRECGLEQRIRFGRTPGAPAGGSRRRSALPYLAVYAQEVLPEDLLDLIVAKAATHHLSRHVGHLLHLLQTLDPRGAFFRKEVYAKRDVIHAHQLLDM